MLVLTLHMNVSECVPFPIAHMVGVRSQEFLPHEGHYGVLNVYILRTHCSHFFFVTTFLLLTVLCFLPLHSFLSSLFGTLNSIWFLWLCCCLWPGTISSSHRGRIPGKTWWVDLVASFHFTEKSLSRGNSGTIVSWSFCLYYIMLYINHIYWHYTALILGLIQTVHTCVSNTIAIDVQMSKKATTRWA